MPVIDDVIPTRELWPDISSDRSMGEWPGGAIVDDQHRVGKIEEGTDVERKRADAANPRRVVGHWVRCQGREVRNAKRAGKASMTQSKVTDPALSIMPPAVLAMSPLMIASIRFSLPALENASLAVPTVSVANRRRLIDAQAALLLAPLTVSRLSSVGDRPELASDPLLKLVLMPSIRPSAATMVCWVTARVLVLLRAIEAPIGPVDPTGSEALAVLVQPCQPAETQRIAAGVDAADGERSTEEAVSRSRQQPQPVFHIFSRLVTVCIPAALNRHPLCQLVRRLRQLYARALPAAGAVLCRFRRRVRWSAFCGR